jgi:hypothetical protein
MNAPDVIESYVHDVARRLPPAKRDDVAYELRALLTDDLAARASAAGRPADEALAVEMLREFGRPGETAIRYHRPFTIVEASDTWSFVVAAIAGCVVTGLLAPADQQLGLAWIGLLAIGYAVKNLMLRRNPARFPWKPRPVRSTDRASRVANGLLAILSALFLCLYVNPAAFLHTISGGRVDTDTLTYSDSFTGELRMPWLIGILALAVVLHGFVAVTGRWRPFLRWSRITLTFLIGSQLGWHTRYGSVFENADVDRVVLPVAALVSAAVILAGAVMLYREYTRVRPAPTPAIP